MQKILIASNNKGKQQEIANLFKTDFPHIEVVSGAKYNLPSPAETSNSFTGNADIKSYYFARQTNMPSLADDSGLCVELLGGKPGVHSARFAEELGGFKQAMAKIEADLQQKYAEQYAKCKYEDADTDTDASYKLPQHDICDADNTASSSNRYNSHNSLGARAFFVCALSLCLPQDGFKIHNFEGKIYGNLSFPPKGNSGFGYDPIFIADGFKQTFAEMPPQEKHNISHRAIAFNKFKQFLKAYSNIA